MEKKIKMNEIDSMNHLSFCIDSLLRIVAVHTVHMSGSRKSCSDCVQSAQVRTRTLEKICFVRDKASNRTSKKRLPWRVYRVVYTVKSIDRLRYLVHNEYVQEKNKPSALEIPTAKDVQTGRESIQIAEHK